ncbi:MAG: 2-hydroxyacyl-CoA dehydratase [Firmicutes bacterium]|nr:2-hydroxyacyl-CoA dehydratase [Bacillota bacterium]
MAGVLNTLSLATDLPGLAAQVQEWLDDPQLSLMSRLKSLYQRPAVGYFPVYSPLEIFEAAGVYPIGVGDVSHDAEMALGESRFPSFVCSIVKSTLDLGLAERLRVLDGVVFHSICDAARNLQAVYARNIPQQWTDYLHFPQNFDSPAASEYLASEYRRLMRRLDAWTDRRMTNDDLLAAIERYNRLRSHLRELYRFRRMHPDLLSTRVLYTLVRALGLLTVEDSLDLLTYARGLLTRQVPRTRDSVRALWIGAFCEKPPWDLVETLEEAGIAIVDDDIGLAHRWFSDDIPLDGDAIMALATAYCRNAVPAAVRHVPLGDRTAALLQRMQKVGADVVVMTVAKFCEPGLYEYAAYRRVLAEQKIPHILIEFDEHMWMFDKVQTDIETFVESVLLN